MLLRSSRPRFLGSAGVGALGQTRASRGSHATGHATVWHGFEHTSDSLATSSVAQLPLTHACVVPQGRLFDRTTSWPGPSDPHQRPDPAHTLIGTSEEGTPGMGRSVGPVWYGEPHSKQHAAPLV